MTTTLNVIVVDDEALARQRLRTLLGDCLDPSVQVTGEAADAVEAEDGLGDDGAGQKLAEQHAGNGQRGHEQLAQLALGGLVLQARVEQRRPGFVGRHVLAIGALG